jgi:MFS family permease
VRRLPFIDTEPLRRFPTFRRLWLGLAVSQMGTELALVAVYYQVYVLTESSFYVGLVSLAQLGPALVGSLLGGSLADAFDRRRMLVVTQVAQALCSAGLALYTLSDAPGIWILYALVATAAFFAGADGPARMSIMVNLVSRDQIPSANALRQLMGQMSVVLGPALGGLLLARFSIATVYLIDAVSFSAVIAVSLGLPALVPEGSGTKFGLRSIVEGFRYLRGRQPLQGIFLADLTAMIFGMPLALFPEMALSHFGGDATVLGYMYAAPGAGALIGALLSGWTVRVTRLGRGVIMAIVVWGLAITAFGLSPWLWLALLMLAVAGWGDMISSVFRHNILQIEAPDRLRGRLTSIQIAVIQAGPRLGNLEAGALGALVGPQACIVIGGIGCLAGITTIARAMPRFAHYVMRIGRQPGDDAEPQGDLSSA